MPLIWEDVGISAGAQVATGFEKAAQRRQNLKDVNVARGIKEGGRLLNERREKMKGVRTNADAFSKYNFDYETIKFLSSLPKDETTKILTSLEIGAAEAKMNEEAFDPYGYLSMKVPTELPGRVDRLPMTVIRKNKMVGEVMGSIPEDKYKNKRQRDGFAGELEKAFSTAFGLRDPALEIEQAEQDSAIALGIPIEEFRALKAQGYVPEGIEPQAYTIPFSEGAQRTIRTEEATLEEKILNIDKLRLEFADLETLSEDQDKFVSEFNFSPQLLEFLKIDPATTTLKELGLAIEAEKSLSTILYNLQRGRTPISTTSSRTNSAFLSALAANMTGAKSDYDARQGIYVITEANADLNRITTDAGADANVLFEEFVKNNPYKAAENWDYANNAMQDFATVELIHEMAGRATSREAFFNSVDQQGQFDVGGLWDPTRISQTAAIWAKIPPTSKQAMAAAITGGKITLEQTLNESQEMVKKVYRSAPFLSIHSALVPKEVAEKIISRPQDNTGVNIFQGLIPNSELVTILGTSKWEQTLLEHNDGAITDAINKYNESAQKEGRETIDVHDLMTYVGKARDKGRLMEQGFMHIVDAYLNKVDLDSPDEDESRETQKRVFVDKEDINNLGRVIHNTNFWLSTWLQENDSILSDLEKSQDENIGRQAQEIRPMIDRMSQLRALQTEGDYDKKYMVEALGISQKVNTFINAMINKHNIVFNSSKDLNNAHSETLKFNRDMQGKYQ